MENGMFFVDPNRSKLYDLLGALLTYPTDSFQDTLENLEHLAETSVYEIAVPLGMFKSLLGKCKLEYIQELYSETFELQAKCSLSIGVQIFGEDTFKRSLFMARLRESFEIYGIKEHIELPDFLPFVMRLSTKIDDFEPLNSLLIECLESPLSKMLELFNSNQHPYGYIIRMLHQMVTFDIKTMNAATLEEEQC